MAVFRIDKTRDYTVMANHHLRNKALSLKAKGLLSLMLSLPDDWDYTTKGLAMICKDGVDSICSTVRELESAGYIQRRRIRDFLFFAQEKQRTYPWDKQRKTGIILFCLATVTLIPLLLQAIVGFCRRPDRAWFYHVPVCWITLWIYGWGTVSKMLGRRQAPVDRSQWQR